MLRKNNEILDELVVYLRAHPITASNRKAVVEELQRCLLVLDLENIDEVRSEWEFIESCVRNDLCKGEYGLFDELCKHGLQPRFTQLFITSRIRQVADEIKQINATASIDRALIAERAQACLSCVHMRGMENITAILFSYQSRIPEFKNIEIKNINFKKEIETLQQRVSQLGFDKSRDIEKKIDRLETMHTLIEIENLQTVVHEEYQASGNPVFLNILINLHMTPQKLKSQAIMASFRLSEEMAAILQNKYAGTREQFAKKLDEALSNPLAKRPNLQLEKLQQDVYDDFIKTRDTSFINVLIRHKMSPLTLAQAARISSSINPELEQAASVLQSWVRSYNRFHTHLGIFKKAPTATKSFSLTHIKSAPAKKAIYELAYQHAAVKGLVYHWTIVSNLKNIIRNGAFYGNEQLVRLGLAFQKNALMEGDVQNGDGNVICFCPYFVDYNALMKRNGEHGFRDDLIRLTVDLSKVKSSGENNQFFKLFDFGAPSFDYSIAISAEFKVRFMKKGTLPFVAVFFSLNDKTFSTYIGRDEAIFYGDLYSINSFCLAKIFDLVARAEPVDEAEKASFEEQFYAYLNKLTEAEIKKLLILFAQGLTIYAEYNFNTMLKLTDHLIAEVYHVKNSAQISLQGLSSDAYQKKLMEATHSQLARSGALLLEYNDANSILFYDTQIFINGFASIIERDFVHVPAEVFAQGSYIETRGAEEVDARISAAFTA